MSHFLRAIVAPLLAPIGAPPVADICRKHGLTVRVHTLRDDNELTIEQANARAHREMARVAKLARARAERDARAAVAKARAEALRAQGKALKFSAKKDSASSKIMHALERGPLSGPQLYERVGIKPSVLWSALRQLELRGHITKTGARRSYEYRRTDRSVD